MSEFRSLARSFVRQSEWVDACELHPVGAVARVLHCSQQARFEFLRETQVEMTLAVVRGYNGRRFVVHMLRRGVGEEGVALFVTG